MGRGKGYFIYECHKELRKIFGNDICLFKSKGKEVMVRYLLEDQFRYLTFYSQKVAEEISNLCKFSPPTRHAQYWRVQNNNAV